jgi:hypothetical protein
VLSLDKYLIFILSSICLFCIQYPSKPRYLLNIYVVELNYDINLFFCTLLGMYTIYNHRLIPTDIVIVHVLDLYDIIYAGFLQKVVNVLLEYLIIGVIISYTTL